MAEITTSPVVTLDHSVETVYVNLAALIQGGPSGFPRATAIATTDPERGADRRHAAAQVVGLVPRLLSNQA